MLRPNSFNAKMSEPNILLEYSNYLQLALNRVEAEKCKKEEELVNFLLTYNEFKEYYVLGLVGKDSFLEDKAREFQFQKI